MSTVSYKNQPAIQETHGNVPLAGTSHLYTVNKVLWPESIQDVLAGLLIGRSLHVCCGKSLLGDVRLDMNEPDADLHCDAANMCDVVADKEFDTVLCDPPYNGKFQWNHDMLAELARVAKKRIIFQHWFIPANKYGQYKKDFGFALTASYVWQPQTYFGRAQIVSVFDTVEQSTPNSTDDGIETIEVRPPAELNMSDPRFWQAHAPAILDALQRYENSRDYKLRKDILDAGYGICAR